MPQYQFTRARDLAPSFFDNLMRIREIDQTRTQRSRALQDFAAREAQRKAAEQSQRQTQSFIGNMNIPGAPSNISGNVALGRQLAARYGWTGRQWDALYNLGMKESGWRNTAQNPTSSAYGIGQFLDKTWGTVGGRKTSDPRLQIQYMLKYIAQRYGNPMNALSGYYNRYGSGRSGY